MLLGTEIYEIIFVVYKYISVIYELCEFLSLWLIIEMASLVDTVLLPVVICCSRLWISLLRVSTVTLWWTLEVSV